MAKNLDLNVKLNADAARRALNGFVSDMNMADNKTSDFSRKARDLGNTLRNRFRSAVDTASNSLQKFRNRLNQASLGSVVSMKNMQDAAKKTGEQMWNLTKRAALVGTATAGMITGKAISNLVEFQDTFQLMNATLGSKLPETTAFLKKEIFSLSKELGKSSTEVTDALTQMFSSGLAPTAAEGTKEYTAQLKNALGVQEVVAKAAIGLGEDVGSLGDAYVRFAINAGLAVDEVESAELVMNIFSGTLDSGIGTMDQYSQQFSKFGAVAKVAGFSMQESAGIFAAMTTSFTPNQAGEATAAFARMYSDITTTIDQGSRAVERGMKGVTNKADLAVLGSVSTSEGFASLFQDAEGNNLNVIDSLEKIREVYGNLETDAAKGLFTKAVGREQTSKRVIDQMLAGDNLDQLITQLEDFEGNYIEKFNETSKSFGQTWRVFKNNINESITEAADAMAPALNTLLSTMSGLMTGKELDEDLIANSFAQARQQVEALNPALLPVVDMLEKMVGYLTSEKAQKDLERLGTLMKGLGSAAMGVMGVISSIANSPLFQMLVDFVANNPLGSLVGGMFGANLLSGGLGVKLGTALAGTLFSGPMWMKVAKFLTAAGPWAVVAGILGTAISNELNKGQEKIDDALADSTAFSQDIGSYLTDRTVSLRDGTATQEDFAGSDAQMVQRLTKELEDMVLNLGSGDIFQALESSGIADSMGLNKRELNKLSIDLAEGGLTSKEIVGLSNDFKALGRFMGDLSGNVTDRYASSSGFSKSGSATVSALGFGPSIQDVTAEAAEAQKASTAFFGLSTLKGEDFASSVLGEKVEEQTSAITTGMETTANKLDMLNNTLLAKNFNPVINVEPAPVNYSPLNSSPAPALGPSGSLSSQNPELLFSPGG